ncbi:MAG: hypothetical protein ACYCS7_03940 [Acidimicrobiales bacterium]
MPTERDDRPTLIDKSTEGPFTFSFYEQTREDGGVKRFWTMTREVPAGQAPLIVGGTMEELGMVRVLIDQAEPFIPWQQTRERNPGIEREATQSQWIAVVCFERTEPDGASARVVKTYAQHEWFQAEEFVGSLEAKRKNLVLVPTVIDERPVAGDTILIPHGMSKATDRHIAELEWKETNGKRFTMGVWYERESGPREGQLVTVGSGREPLRGDAESRKILPHGRPISPGEGENPVFVVVERDEKVFGRGRIVEVHHDHAKAIEHAKGLEQNHQVREQVNGPEWRNQNLRP